MNFSEYFIEVIKSGLSLEVFLLIHHINISRVNLYDTDACYCIAACESEKSGGIRTTRFFIYAVPLILYLWHINSRYYLKKYNL